MEPRTPTVEERGELIDLLVHVDGLDRADAAWEVECAAIAVFPNYQPFAPTDWGKVMAVVWGLAPQTFDVFMWNRGRPLERCDRVR